MTKITFNFLFYYCECHLTFAQQQEPIWSVVLLTKKTKNNFLVTNLKTSLKFLFHYFLAVFDKHNWKVRINTFFFKFFEIELLRFSKQWISSLKLRKWGKKGPIYNFCSCCWKVVKKFLKGKLYKKFTGNQWAIDNVCQMIT